jgi:RHS repeat-associated protein
VVTSRSLVVVRTSPIVCAVFALLVLACVASPRDARAQISPSCVSGCVLNYEVKVTPDGSTVGNRSPYSSGNTVTFTVTNYGALTDTYSFICRSSGNAICTNLSKTSAQLAHAVSTKVIATYSVTDAGLGKITLLAEGEALDEGYFNIPIAAPVSAPAVSLAPYHPSFRSAGTCLANCFDVAWSHSTPSYLSLDAPRNVTLAYNSATVRPLPVILLDVKNQQFGSYPTSYSVQVKRRSTGTWLTLLNGAQIVYFTAPADTGSRVRLAAAVDAQANGLATGSYDVLVTVTSNYASSTSSNTFSTQLLVNDQSKSAFGPGLGLAGVQRLFFGSGNGAVLVTDGNGSMAAYLQGSSSYRTPGGASAVLSGPSGSPAQYRLTHLDGSYVEFNAVGRMVRAADRFGNTTTLAYSDTLLTSIQDPMGKTITLSYDVNKKLSSIRDTPGNRTTTYTRGAADLLVTDHDGLSTHLYFTPENLLSGVVNRAGQQTDYSYDALNRLSAVTAPSVQLYTGTAGRPVVTFVAPELQIWQPAVPGTTSGNPKALVLADSARASVTDPLNATTRFSLDRFGAPLQTIDVLGQLTTITRDTMGRPIAVREPNGHLLLFSYGDGFTNSPYLLVKAQDWNTGRVINYSYTARKDIQEISGDVTTQKFSYHDGTRGPAGALDSATTQGGGAVVHYPDSRGRDTLIVHADTNHKERYGYDPTWGNLATSVDPRNNKTIRHFDGAGRADSTYLPASGAWGVAYGSLNQVLVTKDPLGQMTQTEYNANFTVRRITDPKGQVYKFSYNSLGALVAQHDLADTLKADTLKYDLAGRARSMVTRRGDVISLVYDEAGRLISRSGPDFPMDSYRYDAAGGWVVSVNANAYDSLSFDIAGRPKTDVQKLNGTTFQWNYTVDRQDRIIARDLAAGGGHAGWTYSSGLPTFVSGGGATVSLSQTTERLTDTRVFGGTSWTATQKFTGGHTDSLHTYSQGALNALLGGTFTYDSLNRLMTQKYNGDSKRVYAYDQLGRLLNACDSIGPDCINEWGWGGAAYRYDAAGNRLRGGEQLGVVGPGNRIGQTAGYFLWYDINGNLIKKCPTSVCLTGGSKFTWDALSRLTEVRNAASNALIATFAYDALGRRVAKASGGTTQRYVYDGDRVIFDLNASNQVIAEYGHYDGTDQLLSIKTSAWTGVLLTDPLVGSVHGLAQNIGGAPIKYYDLNAWGRVTTADTGTSTRFRMAGREYDSETGLYYMRARYYDPDLGRFLSEDPAGIAGGLNLYAYAHNDPVNSRDPSGLGEECSQSFEGIDMTVHCPSTGYGSHGGTAYGPVSGGDLGDLGGAAPADGVGRHGWGGGAGSAQARIIAVASDRCITAKAILAASVIGDFATLSGVGVVIKAGLAARAAGTMATYWATQAVTRGWTVGAIEVSQARLGQAVVVGKAAAISSILGDGDLALAGAYNGSPPSLKDFIPIYASIRAYDTMRNVCGP